MSRNAGKKPRGAQPRPSSSGGQWRLPFAGGLLVGLSLAGAAYLLQLLPTAMEIREHEKTCAEGTDAPKPTATATEATDKQPVTFDFYNMLPKQQAPVPGRNTSSAPPVPPVPPTPPASTAPATATVAVAPAPTAPVTTAAAAPPAQAAPEPVAPAKPAEPARTSGRYVLQAGSFATRAEADRRRGELVLSGLSVGVQQATTDKGETRYRVIVGPFANEGAMKDAQKQLAGMKIDTLPVHLK